MKNQNMKSNKGFSLVELIVVIAIMAILIGVLAPSLTKQIDKSRVAKDRSTLDSIMKAVEAALADPDAYEKMTISTSGTHSLATVLGDSDFGKEVQNNLKGRGTADIKFESKDVKGQTGADVTVALDGEGNVKVTVTKGTNTLSVGDLISTSTPSASTPSTP